MGDPDKIELVAAGPDKAEKAAAGQDKFDLVMADRPALTKNLLEQKNNVGGYHTKTTLPAIINQNEICFAGFCCCAVYLE